MVRFVGVGRYAQLGEFDTLAEARAAVAAAGADRFGRGGLIYRLGVPGRYAQLVD